MIGDVADYIVFMGYDQNGVSSPKEGQPLVVIGWKQTSKILGARRSRGK